MVGRYGATEQKKGMRRENAYEYEDILSTRRPDHLKKNCFPSFIQRAPLKKNCLLRGKSRRRHTNARSEESKKRKRLRRKRRRQKNPPKGCGSTKKPRKRKALQRSRYRAPIRLFFGRVGIGRKLSARPSATETTRPREKKERLRRRPVNF